MDFEQLIQLMLPFLKGGLGFSAGKFIDDVGKSDMFTPDKAVAQAGNRRNEIVNTLGGQQGGIPGIGPPPSFQRPQTSLGGGGQLLQNLLQQAQGGFSNPNISTGRQNLQNSLANRNAVRPQRNLTQTPQV